MKLMKTPRLVEIAITGKCNQRCRYCGYFESPADVDGNLPESEWAIFFEELNRYAIPRVTIQGGEPFTREDIKNIIANIVKNRMRFGILTNATLIDQDIAEFISSTRRCEAVRVSVNGSTSKIHDSFTKTGSFDKAIDGIRFLKKYGLNVFCNITVHRKNFKDLYNIAKLILEDINVPAITITAAFYMGKSQENNEEVLLATDELSYAMEVVLRLSNKYQGRIDNRGGIRAVTEMWMQMESARRRKQQNAPMGGYLSACMGPRGVMNTIAVRADGVIVPCILLNHIELGRINQDNLIEIWQHHPDLKKIRERREISLDEISYCKDCDYISYCIGGCAAIGYTRFCEVNHPNPDECLKRFFENGGRLPNNTLYMQQEGIQ